MRRPSLRSDSTRVSRILFSVGISIASVAVLHGQSGARLQAPDVQYVGSFRVPAGGFGSAQGFSLGGAPLAYNPGRDSLFVGGHVSSGMIAEISIPTPVNSAVVSALPFASVLQPFADPTDGGLRTQDFGNGATLGGLLVFDGRLYGTVRTYYDASNQQVVGHYSRSLNLTEGRASPLDSVYDRNSMGFVAGWLATVPSEWRVALRGPAVTGQCCSTIISTTSWGPSAFAWNPADLGIISPAPATPLVYYSSAHPTLGPWDATNPAFGGTTHIGGLAIIGGTSTALFVGRTGEGPFCYGIGTADPSLVGNSICYDPTNLDMGTHAYPYYLQFWAYDLNEWAAAAAGTRQPWQVVPYALWRFDAPTGATSPTGGVAYDERQRRLYVSQLFADEDGIAMRPLIHVFQIR